MLKALFITRMKSLWRMMFGRMSAAGKKRGKAVSILIGIFAVYVVASLLFSIGTMFAMTAEGLIAIKLDWLYWAVAGLMSVTLCFVGSIFVTQKQIFDASDNDMLLSMPVPPSYILISRLLMLAVLNVLYSIMVLLPATVAYYLYTPFDGLQLVFIIIASLLIPFLSLTLSCLFGWLSALILSRIRHKNIFTTVIYIAFFLGYMLVFSNIQSVITNLVNNGMEFGAAIRRSIPPIYHFGTAAGESDVVGLIFTLLWCVLPFALVCVLLSKSFIKIATTNKGTVKIKYVEKELKPAGIRSALLRKEFARFVSLPMYILNSGLGALMMLIFAGAVIVKGPEILTVLSTVPQMSGLLPAVICLAMGFCAIMTNTSAPSISLEGKRMWILRASPVSAWDVFSAKLGVNLILGVPPVIITAVVCWICIPMSVPQMVLVLIVPLFIQVFTSLFGLVANLLFPRFDWLNETLVVKQSASVMMAVFGSMALIGLPALLYFVLPIASIIGVDMFLVMCAGYFVLLSAVCLAFISTKGKRIYDSI
ncbi:MAG: hypothetical protein AB9835_06445 [Eubacteriales bacterium]